MIIVIYFSCRYLVLGYIFNDNYYNKHEIKLPNIYNAYINIYILIKNRIFHFVLPFL